MSEQISTTEAPEGEAAVAVAEKPCASAASEAVRANVAAFRADDNASMMGGWTD